MQAYLIQLLSPAVVLCFSAGFVVAFQDLGVKMATEARNSPWAAFTHPLMGASYLAVTLQNVALTNAYHMKTEMGIGAALQLVAYLVAAVALGVLMGKERMTIRKVIGYSLIIVGGLLISTDTDN